MLDYETLKIIQGYLDSATSRLDKDLLNRAYSNSSLATQIVNFGGVAGYRENMRQRRKLVKKPGFASMDEEKRRLAAQKGGINSGINYRKQKDAEEDGTETVSR